METEEEIRLVDNFFFVWIVDWISDFLKDFQLNPLDFLDYTRQKPCLVHRDEPAEPHHLDTVGMGRNRRKEMIEHLSAVPLSRMAHIEIETVGLREFEDRHGINLWRENARLLARFIWDAR